MLESLNSQPAPMVEMEPLWKIEDVMKYLDCKEVTVWRYMRRYGLPYIKVARTSPLRFRPEAVRNWIIAIEKVNVAQD